MLSRLPIIATIAGAYGAVLGNLGTLIKAGLIPFLILVLLGVVSEEFSGTVLVQLITWALALPFVALWAIAVHRTVLLGPDSLASPWSLTWSDRESSFVVWLIIFTVLGYAAGLAFLAVAWMLPEIWMIVLAAVIFGLWLEARFSMVLPATALDRSMRLSQSWYLTSGNDISLMIVLGLPFLLLAGIMALLTAAFGDSLTIIIVVVFPLLALLTAAVQIAVLSLSYQWLKEEAEEA